jgi:rubrerythrin
VVNDRDVNDVARLLGERQTTDRRAFFRVLGTGGLALVAGGVVAACGGSSSTSSTPTPTPSSKPASGDVKILSLAITAEYLAVDAYTKAIAANKFTGITAETMTTFKDHEQQHVDALKSALHKMSAAVPAVPTFTYPAGTFDSATSIVTLALTAEAAFVGAYLGVIASLSTPELKQAAATIGFNEGEHRVVLRGLAQMTPYVDLAFEKPITADQAQSVVGSFVKK